MSKDARDLIIRLINDKYGLLIYKAAFEILHDRDAVEDVKQEVLIKCSMKVETLEKMKENHMAAYIYTAAKNTAINEYRRRIVAAKAIDKYIFQEGDNLIADRVDFVAFESKYGFSAEMMEILENLSEIDRDILVMKFYHRFSNEEIARELNTNVEHVKKRFQRAKKKLAVMLTERGEGGE